VLSDIERAGGTISGEKSDWYAKKLNIVGYTCDDTGRMPISAKVSEIVNWPPRKSVKEVRSFLGICTYYRIWILNYTRHAAPLYRLLYSNIPFVWGAEQDKAFQYLKDSLTTAPALKTLNTSLDGGRIIVAVDASLGGWGAVLMQEDKNSFRHPCRYESGIWNDTERRYDAGKRECRGLMRALSKFRVYLYSMRFIVQTDANTLVHQLNLPASDLPGAAITR
jgi:hypothetical protein